MNRSKTIVLEGAFDFSRAWKEHFQKARLDGIWVNPMGNSDETQTWRDALGQPKMNGSGAPVGTPFDEALRIEPYPTTGRGAISFEAHIIHPATWLSTRRVKSEFLQPKDLVTPGFEHIFSVITEGKRRQFDFRVVILLPAPPDPDSPTNTWQGPLQVPVLAFSRYGCDDSDPSTCRLELEQGGEENGLWTPHHRVLGIRRQR